MGLPSLVSRTSVFLQTIFPFLASTLHRRFPLSSPFRRPTRRLTQAQIGRTSALIAIGPLHVHLTSRHIWIHTTLREQSHLCVPTVAASALSVANMTCNVIGPLFTGTKRHRPQYTQTHPEFQNLPLVSLLALELGAINVERVMLGKKGVASAMISSKCSWLREVILLSE